MIVSEAEKKLILSLLSCDGFGRKTVETIINEVRQHTETPERFLEVIATSKTISSKIKNVCSSIKKYDLGSKYDSLMHALEKDSIRVLWQGDPHYPPLLVATEDPPLCLFTKGQSEVLTKPCIAVIGTRKMTAYGAFATKHITQQLLDGSDAVIVSGCMYGVDARAHQIVLQNAKSTIGVLGYGFSHVYPQSVAQMLEQIVQTGGCLVSEYVPSKSPRPGYFLARNRIIAGISLGTIVVEAGAKSGSHATAIRAAELGREVFAVPGPITNPYSEGPKQLINDGALLISSGIDVLEALHLYLGGGGKSRFHPLQTELANPKAGALLDLLREYPQSEDSLLQTLQLPSQQLAVLLTELELQGSIERNGILWYLK